MAAVALGAKACGCIAALLAWRSRHFGATWDHLPERLRGLLHEICGITHQRALVRIEGEPWLHHERMVFIKKLDAMCPTYVVHRRETLANKRLAWMRSAGLLPADATT